jgi:beta-phosphoglucomutase-like phosphatase (HAD superfamily)
MDPITLAIVSAVAAGAVEGGSKVAEQVIMDAYQGLKGLINRKFGQDSKIAQAIDEIEEDPKDQLYQQMLAKRVKNAEADEDSELVAKANELLEQLKAKPEGASLVQNIYGSFNAVTGSGGTATVNVYGKPPEDLPKS